jgi:hypothetical protein
MHVVIKVWVWKGSVNVKQQAASMEITTWNLKKKTTMAKRGRAVLGQNQFRSFLQSLIVSWVYKQVWMGGFSGEGPSSLAYASGKKQGNVGGPLTMPTPTHVPICIPIIAERSSRCQKKIKQS